MHRSTLALTLVLLAGAGPAVAAPALRVGHLDASQVTERVPLVRKYLEATADGRRQSRWPMWGKSPDQLFVVGDDQRDADAVRWQCHERGPGAPPATVTVTVASSCGRFFVSVLQNVVSQPKALAADLLARARPGVARATWAAGDFAIETDGEDYLVRRYSRRRP